MNCQWSNYGEWTTCSESCGGGKRVHSRKKIIEAENGGKDCEGPDTQIEECNTNHCPGEKSP